MSFSVFLVFFRGSVGEARKCRAPVDWPWAPAPSFIHFQKLLYFRTVSKLKALLPGKKEKECL